MIAGALACVLAGAVIALGVYSLWQLGSLPVTTTFKKQMMDEKTQTMEQILDGLVRGNLKRVEDSAEHMKSIGLHVNWYSSSETYENNDEHFRQSTFDLIDAVQRRDHDEAKESALRLERSCIECHSLINRNNHSNQ
jgi:hypothetical protein